VASRRAKSAAACEPISPKTITALPNTTDLFVSAGEASGDLEAALLLREVQRLRPGTTCRAIGSERLRAAGAAVEIDSSDWASIGPLSALVKVPHLWLTMRRMDARLRSDEPRLFMPVDFGAFNLTLLRRMRRAGYRGDAVYYFPPGAWLDDARQAHLVAGVATPLTPFEHQRDFYRSLGLPCAYFGHPLVSAIAPRVQIAKTWPPELGVTDRGGPRIVVFPGSRREEIQRMLTILARAARVLGVSRDATFVLAAS
jgi:lipid-A-disaccharide synthase